MEQQIFRGKSVQRLSSPEQLNDYLRVSSPSVWLCLGAIVILLIGVCVWGVFGRLDTTLHTAAIAQGGALTCLIREEDAGRVKAGMTVSAGGESAVLSGLSAVPQTVPADTDPYALHVGGLMAGEWVYTAAAPTGLPDGVYEGVITIESVSPMSFVLN